jgi:hypothetical protein
MKPSRERNGGNGYVHRPWSTMTIHKHQTTSTLIQEQNKQSGNVWFLFFSHIYFHGIIALGKAYSRRSQFH